MKVLLVLEHATDYRERFLRSLADVVELDVVAKPCSEDNLSDPPSRVGYRYFEYPTKRFGGLVFQPNVSRRIANNSYDVICCDLNVRHVDRLIAFLRFSRKSCPWVWRGQIFGRTESRLVHGIRSWLVRRGDGCLVYSNDIAKRVQREFGLTAISFNNSHASREDFVVTGFPDSGPLRLLFVGRWQQRKRLERLVELAERRRDVRVRLVGPGMENESIPIGLGEEGRVMTYPRTSGDELRDHFEWADLVVSPGHVGLLVMNAAQHGKGIVIDETSVHAPERLLAAEAAQPFVDFTEAAAVDKFLDAVLKDRDRCKQWADRLRSVGRDRYTVEQMVEQHVNCFWSAIAKWQRGGGV